mmetsp:Transcript_21267/g.18877  ORF Transcript_21267/g.18877 Transcript_21267/m.18877 type:complete len:84 (-) Transcript_21267:25-276(-)
MSKEKILNKLTYEEIKEIEEDENEQLLSDILETQWSFEKLKLEKTKSQNGIKAHDFHKNLGLYPVTNHMKAKHMSMQQAMNHL